MRLPPLMKTLTKNKRKCLLCPLHIHYRSGRIYFFKFYLRRLFPSNYCIMAVVLPYLYQFNMELILPQYIQIMEAFFHINIIQLNKTSIATSYSLNRSQFLICPVINFQNTGINL